MVTTTARIMGACAPSLSCDDFNSFEQRRSKTTESHGNCFASVCSGTNKMGQLFLSFVYEKPPYISHISSTKLQ